MCSARAPLTCYAAHAELRSFRPGVKVRRRPALDQLQEQSGVLVSEDQGHDGAASDLHEQMRLCQALMLILRMNI